MTIASISQDLHRFIRRVGTLTNKQAYICDVDWDDQPVDRFWVDIKPNSGYYEGGVFRFKVILPSDYESDDPPTVICETPIYHPNINTTSRPVLGLESNVCLSILDNGTWKRKYGLESIVKSLVYLVKNPNIDSPLTPGFSDTTMEDFARNVEQFVSLGSSADALDLLTLDDDDDDENQDDDDEIEDSRSVDSDGYVRYPEEDDPYELGACWLGPE